MFNVASAAQEIVFEVARPYGPLDNTKAKQNRAAARLAEHGLEFSYARVERAWKGRAGPRIYVALKAAFESWSQSIAAEDKREIAARFARLEEALNASDPEFYRPALEAMRTVLGDPSYLVRSNSGSS